jgi:hypothetical protein
MLYEKRGDVAMEPIIGGSKCRFVIEEDLLLK